ncbi:MAG: hypothetical protein CMJ59_18350 [Planctomycetaceae bacterium]|nr:hypothetical protein [Planctomycetaceae bacterium]
MMSGDSAFENFRLIAAYVAGLGTSDHHRRRPAVVDADFLFPPIPRGGKIAERRRNHAAPMRSVLPRKSERPLPAWSEALFRTGAESCVDSSVRGALRGLGMRYPG